MNEPIDHDLHAVNRAAKRVADAASRKRETEKAAKQCYRGLSYDTASNLNFMHIREANREVFKAADDAAFAYERALDAYEGAVGRAQREAG